MYQSICDTIRSLGWSTTTFTDCVGNFALSKDQPLRCS